MDWTVIYPLAMAVVLVIAWVRANLYGNEVAYHCAVLLTLWMGYLNFFYVCGVVERKSTIRGLIVFIAAALVLYLYHRHWLPMVFFLSGSGFLLWTIPFDGTPFEFKSVRNSVFVGQWTSICFAWRNEWTRMK